MDVSNSKVLEITVEENEAAHRYQGSSTEINELLGNFISDESISLYSYRKEDNTPPYYSEAGLNRVILDIEKIYSAMVKTMMSYETPMHQTLYRGGSSFMQDGRRNAFTSTTTKNTEAVGFATSKSSIDNSAKAYVDYISIDGKIPFYVMDRKGNESEILISPFVMVKSSNQTVGSWNGHSLNLDKVILKKDTLRELSEEQMSELHTDICSRAEEIGSIVNECLQYEQELKRINMQLSVNYESYREVKTKYNEKLKVVKDWKEKFALLMEGRCRNIEKTLEMEFEKEQHPIKEEVKPVEKTPEQSEPEKPAPVVDKTLEKASESVVDKPAEKVSETIPESKKLIQSCRMQLEGILTEPMKIARQLRGFRVNYQSPCANIEEQLRRLRNLEDVPMHDTAAISKINSYIAHKQPGERFQIAKELSDLEQNEFKRAIARSVTKMRASQEKTHLISEEKALQNEKIGIMGMLSGKEKEKQARLNQISTQKANIDGVIQCINHNGLTANNRYSVHDILADIQILVKDESVSREDHEAALTYRSAIMNAYKQNVDQDKVILKTEEKEKSMSGNDRAEKFMQSVSPTVLRGFDEKRRETKAEIDIRSVFDAINNSKDRNNSNDIDK
jgi:hypothetical protein